MPRDRLATVRRVLDFVRQHAMSKHPVGGNVAADINISTELRQHRITRFGDADERTGLGIGLAKRQEVSGRVGWQNDQIALHVSGTKTGGISAMETGANLSAQFQWAWRLVHG
jgi:hypothetical protein